MLPITRSVECNDMISLYSLRNRFIWWIENQKGWKRKHAIKGHKKCFVLKAWLVTGETEQKKVRTCQILESDYLQLSHTEFKIQWQYTIWFYIIKCKNTVTKNVSYLVQSLHIVSDKVNNHTNRSISNFSLRYSANLTIDSSLQWKIVWLIGE